ncbi:CAP-Gly domain-containing linker protein 1-like [Zophobas morio]|uniref:CAP-Gly domain-containing linker protein 1-like n=1 Tax=Zophobas morio TaxID=2755281 RepID=UPI0030829856
MEQFLAKEKELEDVMNNFQDLKNDVGLKDALLDALKKENAELLYTNKSLNDFIEHLEAVKEEALMLLKSFINEAQTSPLLERRTESEFTWKNILEELKKKKDEILAGIRSREAELTRVTTCLEELKMRYDSLREKKDHEITSLKETLESECTQREKLATEKAQVEKVNEESLAQLESLTLLNKKLLSEKAQLQHLLEEKNKILQEKERTNTLEGLRPEKEDVCFLVECWPDSFKKFLRVLLEESSRYFLEKRSGSLMESTNYFEKTAAEFDHFEETTKKELYAFIEKVVNFKKKEAGNLDIGQKEVGANKENSGEYLASSRLLDDSLHREISRCKESLRKMNDVLQLKEKDIFKLNNLVNILKEEQRHYAQGWIEHVVKETCEAMFASGHQPTFNNCEDSTWASEAGFTFLRKTDLDFIQKRKEAYICYVSEKIERFQRSEKRCFQQQYEQLLLLMKSKVLEHNRQQQELFQAQFKAEKRILAQKINAYYQGQLENCTCRQRSLRPYPLFTA